MTTTTESLLEVFRAHLDKSEISLAYPNGRLIDGVEETDALQDLAELAVDVLTTVPEFTFIERSQLSVTTRRTRELDPAELNRLVANSTIR